METRLVPSFALLTLVGAVALSRPVAADMRTVVPAATPAAAPENVGAEPGNAKVRLTWSPVAGAEGYRIYQGANGAWMSTPVARTTGTSHTSHGLANGTMYSFTVAAYTKSGNGPLSLAVSAMPLAPPEGVTAKGGDHRVTLTWLASAGATSYTIYRRIGNEPAFRELTTGVLVSPFVDPQLANGTRYYYRIGAVTAATQSQWSAQVSAVPASVLPVTAPVAISTQSLDAFEFCSASQATRPPGRLQRLWRAMSGPF
jgi:cellulose 1,4-beta-cellobiosidase